METVEGEGFPVAGDPFGGPSSTKYWAITSSGTVAAHEPPGCDRPFVQETICAALNRNAPMIPITA